MFHKDRHHDRLKRVRVRDVAACDRMPTCVVDELVERLLVDGAQRAFEVVPLPAEGFDDHAERRDRPSHQITIPNASRRSCPAAP